MLPSESVFCIAYDPVQIAFVPPAASSATSFPAIERSGVCRSSLASIETVTTSPTFAMLVKLELFER